MLDFIKDKNIFDCDVDYIVNPVNCVGAMGKGLALQFKLKYPVMYSEYKKACDNNKIKIGCLYIVPTFTSDTREIILFPTKVHWKDNSKLDHIDAGLKYLVLSLSRAVKNSQKMSIAIPKIGCGLGGLNWEKQVKPLIINKLSPFKDNKNIKILILE